MDLEFTDDQRAVLESVRAIVQDHITPPTDARRGFFHYSDSLERELLTNGFFDAIRTPGMGALEASLVVEETARSASLVEVAATALVAPSVLSDVLPRPIALAAGDLTKPVRYLPIAKTLIYDAGDKVIVFDINPDNVEPIESIYAFPMGRFRAVPDRSDGREIGGPEVVQTLRQWWRVAIAAECAGALQSAVEFVVDYAKERRLFNTTVASFQAVQHRLAHAHRITRGAQYLALKAAWSGTAFDANQAAGFVQQHISTIVFDLHQFNGGMGVTNENLLHFWTYRVRALQSEVGGANQAALETADELWGKTT